MTIHGASVPAQPGIGRLAAAGGGTWRGQCCRSPLKGRPPMPPVVCFLLSFLHFVQVDPVSGNRQTFLLGEGLSCDADTSSERLVKSVCLEQMVTQLAGAHLQIVFLRFGLAEYQSGVDGLAQEEPSSPSTKVMRDSCVRPSALHSPELNDTLP